METEINEVKEPTTEVNEKPTKEWLIKRYSEVMKISLEESEAQIGADTPEEILKNIEQKTLEHIRSKQVPMNRAQRRALKKKVGAKKYAEMVSESGDIVSAVSETAEKLNQIDLIKKLSKLNEEKEKNGNIIDEDD